MNPLLNFPFGNRQAIRVETFPDDGFRDPVPDVGSTPLVRALLLERVAWASAKAGDTEGTRRTLDMVGDTYERSGADEPEWVYWLNRAEIDFMAGRCMIELGYPAQAEPLLSSAIASYPADHAREVALYLSWLAESHARGGDLDSAREALERGRSCSCAMPSSRTDDRLDAVQRLLPR